MILRKRPELIFLDIQMPDMDGFEMVSEIEYEYKPIVIIVSAFDQYGIKAFNINAIDYLQKPFEESRFHLSLKRVKNKLNYRMQLC